MDVTIAIIGILAVVVALCAYLFVPEWIKTRRRRLWGRDLQRLNSGQSEPMPPVASPEPPPDQPN